MFGVKSHDRESWVETKPFPDELGDSLFQPLNNRDRDVIDHDSPTYLLQQKKLENPHLVDTKQMGLVKLFKTSSDLLI